MDEKKTEPMNPTDETKVKTRVKIRLQNPIVKETVKVPVAEAPAENADEAKQKPRWMERAVDVLKGVGIGVAAVLAVGTAYVIGVNKQDPEPAEDEEDEEEPEESGEDDAEIQELMDRQNESASETTE